MRLASFHHRDGAADVGILTDGALRPLGVRCQGGNSPMRQLLLDTDGDLRRAVASDGPAVALGDVVIDPVVPDPGKVVAAPVNYRDHQAEMKEEYHVDSLGVFLKAPTSVVGHGATVRLPYTDRRIDQEGELAVVIGRSGRHLSPGSAMGVVAGFTILLDMTMRGGEDRSTRKSFDTFTPVGPYLVTPDEAGDPAAMRLRTWVGGRARQDADVSDLIWDLPRLLAYTSSVMTLLPGDIVTTGTPAGVGEVGDGDDVAVEITGLGRLEVLVSARGAVPCPTRGAQRGPTPPAPGTPVRARTGS